MNTKTLALFLGLEVLAIIWAGAVFKIFESRLLAGAMAGAYFVLSAGYMFAMILRWRDRWRALTLYAVSVQLFVIALPMVITRFWNYARPFEDVRILGLAGPEFHSLSTRVFSVLMVATVIDAIRAWNAKRGGERPVARIEN